MLITCSSRILARFHTGPPEILADGNFAFRPDLSKILTARGFVSHNTPTEISGYPPRIPARLPPGSRRDFGRRESRLPPRIPVRIPAGTGNPGGQNLGGIPAGILPGSWQDPAKILVPFLQAEVIIICYLLVTVVPREAYPPRVH